MTYDLFAWKCIFIVIFGSFSLFETVSGLRVRALTLWTFKLDFYHIWNFTDQGNILYKVLTMDGWGG